MACLSVCLCYLCIYRQMLGELYSDREYLEKLMKDPGLWLTHPVCQQGDRIVIVHVLPLRCYYCLSCMICSPHLPVTPVQQLMRSCKGQNTFCTVGNCITIGLGRCGSSIVHVHIWLHLWLSALIFYPSNRPGLVVGRKDKSIYHTVEEALCYLDARTEFWRQQKPMYTRKREKETKKYKPSPTKPQTRQYPFLGGGKEKKTKILCLYPYSGYGNKAKMVFQLYP